MAYRSCLFSYGQSKYGIWFTTNGRMHVERLIFIIFWLTPWSQKIHRHALICWFMMSITFFSSLLEEMTLHIYLKYGWSPQYTSALSTRFRHSSLNSHRWWGSEHSRHVATIRFNIYMWIKLSFWYLNIHGFYRTIPSVVSCTRMVWTWRDVLWNIWNYYRHRRSPSTDADSISRWRSRSTSIAISHENRE